MNRPLPANPPKQSRSRKTLERIVRASLQILEDEGPEGLTVQAIVARAGSSVGSFYARFAGKDQLLEYLGERVWREAAERWDQALASRDWGDVDLRGLVAGSVRLLGEAGRSRATYLRALEGTPGARDDAYAAFQAHVLGGMEELLLARANEMDHPDPAVGVRLGLRAVLGVLDEPLPDGGEVIPLERRMEEASALLLGYLHRGEGRHTLGSGQVDFFDIWG
ncbi:MAG: hypothetical protein AMXMBFR53_33270 [Gemmatimonadota bacterium]